MNIGCLGLLVEPYFSVRHTITASEIPFHAHSEYVISYYFSGESRCRVGSGLGLEFRRGDTALLNPGDAHRDYSTKRARDYLMVNIKKEFFRDISSALGREMKELPLFMAPKIKTDPGLKRIFETLQREVDGRDFGREVMVRSLVTELALHLFRAFTPSPVALDRHENELKRARYQVRRAIEYLQDNYTHPFSLCGMAAEAGLSKYHLERVFKEAVGLPPHTYMLMLRIERAKQLLATTTKPIAEIALDLGFSHQSHLSNVFKRLAGVTPGSYRLGAHS